MSPYFAPASRKNGYRMASTLTIGMPQIAASTARSTTSGTLQMQPRRLWVSERRGRTSVSYFKSIQYRLQTAGFSRLP
jgi:hypothetical protein